HTHTHTRTNTHTPINSENKMADTFMECPQNKEEIFCDHGPIASMGMLSTQTVESSNCTSYSLSLCPISISMCPQRGIHLEGAWWCVCACVCVCDVLWIL